MTGDETFADVMTANAAYARGFDRRGLSPQAARGLAVLTCMDSRIDPLAMLGLHAGDAKILRNGGARVTDEVLATLVIARYLLAVERLMVIAHTGCRMVAADDSELHTAIREAGGPDTTDLVFSTTPDQEAAVRGDVDRVRAFEKLSGLETGGFVYDTETGRLSQIC
ncbi:MAG: beta-class carbonic anhydrase [Gaiellaceae bacterium]